MEHASVYELSISSVIFISLKWCLLWINKWVIWGYLTNAWSASSSLYHALVNDTLQKNLVRFCSGYSSFLPSWLGNSCNQHADLPLSTTWLHCVCLDCVLVFLVFFCPSVNVHVGVSLWPSELNVNFRAECLSIVLMMMVMMIMIMVLSSSSSLFCE